VCTHRGTFRGVHVHTSGDIQGCAHIGGHSGVCIHRGTFRGVHIWGTFRGVHNWGSFRAMQFAHLGTFRDAQSAHRGDIQHIQKVLINISFLNISWRAIVCWPLLCLCRPFVITTSINIYFKYCSQRTCYSSFVHVVQTYMNILQRDHAIISLSFCPPYLSFSLSLIPVVNLPPVSTTPAANNGNNIRLLIP
jgi:hypothetical protein